MMKRYLPVEQAVSAAPKWPAYGLPSQSEWLAGARL